MNKFPPLAAIGFLSFTLIANCSFGQIMHGFKGVPAFQSAYPSQLPSAQAYSNGNYAQPNMPFRRLPAAQRIEWFQGDVPTEAIVGEAITNVYTPPRRQKLNSLANVTRPSETRIPLFQSRGFQSRNLSSVPSSALVTQEPVTNVYRPPSSKRKTSSPVPSDFPSTIGQPALQQKMDSAIDAAELNQSSQQDGTQLKVPHSSQRDFFFQIDGQAYRSKPGQTINLDPSRNYNLRFSGGVGLGDRIATLEAKRKYVFDFRGGEGWVLVPVVDTTERPDNVD